MAKTLSQIGVETNYLVRAWHVSQSIDALTGADDYDITISGSLTLTGSMYVNGLETSSTNDVLTYDSTTGEVTYISLEDLVVGNALTASYVDLVAGPNIIINQVGTSFEISSSTGTTNTGSFTGSFTGSLLGTSSYVNLVEGPNITINQVGILFEISGSAANINTGSFLVTSSIASNTITFTKGDSSTFPIIIPGMPNPPLLLYNQYIPSGSGISFQIPSGNCTLIYDLNININFYPFYIFLPTSSFFLGDTLSFFFTINTPEPLYSGIRISQTSSQQILGDSILNNSPYSNKIESTIGSSGYLLINPALNALVYGNRFTLTCVETSSADTNYARWILSYNNANYDNDFYDGYNIVYSPDPQVNFFRFL